MRGQNNLRRREQNIRLTPGRPAVRVKCSRWRTRARNDLGQQFAVYVQGELVERVSQIPQSRVGNPFPRWRYIVDNPRLPPVQENSLPLELPQERARSRGRPCHRARDKGTRFACPRERSVLGLVSPGSANGERLCKPMDWDMERLVPLTRVHSSEVR
jgi:hypothetical protein